MHCYFFNEYTHFEESCTKISIEEMKLIVQQSCGLNERLKGEAVLKIAIMF